MITPLQPTGAIPSAVCALVIALMPLSSHAGKLEEVRQEVRGEDDSDEDSPSSGGDSSSASEAGFDDGCLDDDCEEGGGLIWAAIVGFAFHLPHLLLEGEDAYPMNGWFNRFPYQRGAPGYMEFHEYLAPTAPIETTPEGDYIIDEGTDPSVDRPPGTRPLALRLAGEYSHDLGDIHKPAGYFLFSTIWRIGLEGGITYFRERLQDGANDQLAIGDINLVFRFAQQENIQMRAGLGARLMYDAAQVTPGFNFTYGMDIYPVFPLVLSASIDLGNLGMAFCMHGRGTIGAVFYGVEIYAGWDGFLIGSVHVCKSVNL